MLLQIQEEHLKQLVSRFPELDHLNEQLKLSTHCRVQATQLSHVQRGEYLDLVSAAATSDSRQLAQLVALHEALQEDQAVFAEGQLEDFLVKLVDYLIHSGGRGWLFKAREDGKLSPWLVTRIDYMPAGEEEAARIMIEVKANSLGKQMVASLNLRERDTLNQTVPAVLASKGWFRETPTLLAEFDKSADTYFQWRSWYGREFLARGTGIFAEDPKANKRDSDWTRKRTVVLSSSGDNARLVNDESLLGDRDLPADQTGEVLAKLLKRSGRLQRLEEETESALTNLQEQISPSLFRRVPVHGYILLFHLELHHHVWVHVADLQPYTYKPDLRDKLVLPEGHTELIDILTAEMDVLMDDIVAGKSGGTTVLCAGPAGVGKTLTAEVYAEIIGRPLYRVHSGQLGLNVSQMEECLKDTLTRAQRWGAVMLIDEADVYIKKRQDSIADNAVVGVFLRVLEYFNGLLFLTTNRVDDIDEAIISRCIALIRYEKPVREDRLRIWQVMSEQFGIALEPTLLETLTDGFDEACGRDIKGLCKLVAKYTRCKELPPTLEVFRLCSQFRGMRFHEQ